MTGYNIPPLPEPLPRIERASYYDQPDCWLFRANDQIDTVRRELSKSGLETRMDMSKELANRRAYAIINTIDIVIDRYSQSKDIDERIHIGDHWFELNFQYALTYNTLEKDSYILCAAAIWILDQITNQPDWRTLLSNIQQIIPSEGIPHGDVSMPNIWDSCFVYELIEYIVYILRNRSKDIAPIEMDDEATPRVITNSLNAFSKHYASCPSAEAFHAILNMIPHKAVEDAVDHFVTLLWDWTDRFFTYIKPIDIALNDTLRKINILADEFNRTLNKLAEVTDEMYRINSIKRQKVSESSPSLSQFPPAMIQRMEQFIVSRPGQKGSRLADESHLHNKALELIQRASTLRNHLLKILDIREKEIETLDRLSLDIKRLIVDFLRWGYIPEHLRSEYSIELPEQLNPLVIEDPYELCFALLSLIDRNVHLPWLYGPGCGLMQAVVDSLPWGFIKYDSARSCDSSPADSVGEKPSSLARKQKTAKPLNLPDWYARKYVSKQTPGGFQRSLAQILYEETSCILPRDFSHFVTQFRKYKEYGIASRDTFLMMHLSSVLSHAHSPITAFVENDNSDSDNHQYDIQDAATSQDDLLEKLRQLQETNKRLRTALHDAEAASREVRKELTSVQETARLEHRELADIRELLFNLENASATDETAQADEPALFPYEVQHDTLVFGGHETWLKAIKGMLSGRIRFIDKDLVFDVNIVRHCDILWIQTNAMSHTQYYRIIDTARQHSKPIRYFTYASASKCAEQVLKADS